MASIVGIECHCLNRRQASWQRHIRSCRCLNSRRSADWHGATVRQASSAGPSRNQQARRISIPLLRIDSGILMENLVRIGIQSEKATRYIALVGSDHSILCHILHLIGLGIWVWHCRVLIVFVGPFGAGG